MGRQVLEPQVLQHESCAMVSTSRRGLRCVALMHFTVTRRRSRASACFSFAARIAATIRARQALLRTVVLCAINMYWRVLRAVRQRASSLHAKAYADGTVRIRLLRGIGKSMTYMYFTARAEGIQLEAYLSNSAPRAPLKRSIPKPLTWIVQYCPMRFGFVASDSLERMRPKRGSPLRS